jgi:hypothetical protein
MCFVFQFFFPSTTVGSCATSITWHQGQRRACMFAQRAAGQSREGCACMASDVRKLEKEWPLLLLAINGKAVAYCWNSFARSARVLVSRSQQKSNSRLAVKKNYKWHIKSVMSFAPSISPRWKSRVCTFSPLYFSITFRSLRYILVHISKTGSPNGEQSRCYVIVQM